jgi:glycerol-3-phosphate dehydrogenase
MMKNWEKGWRDQVWSEIHGPWDLIIIGGGITGAGILREASRAGLKTLLVEQHDFAAGTSSRSSKLVHGGFRYLKNAQIRLTYQSVRERERLQREGRGLVSSLSFLMPTFTTDPLSSWMLGFGLSIYDLLALKWGHRHYEPKGFCALCPQLTVNNLTGGYRYVDALTDDARMVIRLLREAAREGVAALNYARVEGLLHSTSGQVSGVILRDLAPGGKSCLIEVQGRVVINATGAWADDVRALADANLNKTGGESEKQHLRKLRGSHLVFPWSKFPLQRAVSVWHPKDNRPVFAFPWEGVTILGTTDVEHLAPLQMDPAISQSEVDYLMEVVQRAFPALELSEEEVQSTYSGIRAVVDTGKENPSEESREHVLWNENGLLTITGGKLTTFRLMAHAALQAVRSRLPENPKLNPNLPILNKPPSGLLKNSSLKPEARLRLAGRYGSDAAELVDTSAPGELESIDSSPAMWAELRWAARAEGIVHLEDLLLRRVRLGMMIPGGGIDQLPEIQARLQDELDWDKDRWELEKEQYTHLWKNRYNLPRNRIE